MGEEGLVMKTRSINLYRGILKGRLVAKRPEHLQVSLRPLFRENNLEQELTFKICCCVLLAHDKGQGETDQKQTGPAAKL